MKISAQEPVDGEDLNQRTLMTKSTHSLVGKQSLTELAGKGIDELLKELEEMGPKSATQIDTKQLKL